MKKEDIYIRKIIVHILDNKVGQPVLSDQVMDYGSDIAEFVKEHIAKIAGGDTCKECEFYKDQSEVYRMVKDYQDDQFVETSKQIAEMLYDIMISNIDIPSADLCITRFKCDGVEYLAILKLNYKEFYTHRTMKEKEESNNELILHKAILPLKSQKLNEAAVINLSNHTIRLVEKKYEVNGEKTNYFSYLFLKCAARMSHKSRLAVVAKAIESVQRESYEENQLPAENMKARCAISEALEEYGQFDIEELAEQVFDGNANMVGAFNDIIERYDLTNESVQPRDEKTLKTYEKQCVTTDTGIEIKIPMEQYKDPAHVEFVTNPNGTISVMIKNVGRLSVKM